MSARITDHWLPLDEEVLAALGWDEGTQLDIEVAGDTLIVTRSESQEPPKRVAPAKKAKLGQ